MSDSLLVSPGLVLIENESDGDEEMVQDLLDTEAKPQSYQQPQHSNIRALYIPIAPPVAAKKEAKLNLGKSLT